MTARCDCDVCALRRDHPNLDASRTLQLPCADCGRDTLAFGDAEWYIVRDHVWAAAGMDGYSSGYLCIGCLEGRLGRPLTGADFPPEIPVNEPSPNDTPRLYALKRAATTARAAAPTKDAAAVFTQGSLW